MSTENLEKLREALAEDEAPHNHTEILASAARSHFGWSTPTVWGGAKLGYRSRDAEVAELVEALRECETALASCYDVVEWPADGDTNADKALATVRAVLAKHTPKGGAS